MNRRNFIKTVGASVLTPAVSFTQNELTADEFAEQMPESIHGRAVRVSQFQSEEHGGWVSANFSGRCINRLYFQEKGDNGIDVYVQGVSHTADSVSEALDFSSHILETVTANHVITDTESIGERIRFQWYLFNDSRLVDARFKSETPYVEQSFFSLDGEVYEFSTPGEKRDCIHETIKTEVGWL